MTARRVPSPARLIAAVQKRLQRIELPEWPLFGLTDAGGIGYVAGIGQTHEGVVCLRLDYRLPGDAERVIVQTARSTRPSSLDAVIEAVEADHEGTLPSGDPAQTDRSQGTELAIDGDSHTARVLRRGDVRAWSLHIDAVEVVVALARTDLVPRLRRVHDLAPFIEARTEAIAAALRRKRSR